MSATRTQIYLTPEMRARIDRVARVRGTTMADVMRCAVDQYVEDAPDPATVLASTFGADPKVTAPSREWTRG
jgi:predicted DNA-binding protein